MPVCGKCHESHPSVADIRACYGVVASGFAQELADTISEPYAGAVPAREIQNAATPAQLDFIRSLYGQLEGEVKAANRDLSRLDRKGASSLITDLKIDLQDAINHGTVVSKPSGFVSKASETGSRQILAADFPLITEGFYAEPEMGREALEVSLDTKWIFFKVDVPAEDSKWHGRIFVKRVLGGGHGEMDRNYVRVPNVQARGWLSRFESAEEVAAAKMAFGQRIGCCGECGRELTDENSIELGIGPVCAAKGGS